MKEAIRLMKGNEAIGEAAIRAGCTAYFGYPITPQNELTAYMATEMLPKGRVFIQAESEVAAINMVFGAAATGVRAMTSSSSPGISLKQEGISYLAGADLPAVIVDVARSGPGLGGISPGQGDYFQATRGGGHGDYYTIVLAPKSVQESADLTYQAFALADKYRMPVLVLTDGLLGQMMEGVIFPEPIDPASLPRKTWAVGHQARDGRDINHISSMNLDPPVLEKANLARFKHYETVKAELCRYEEVQVEDADLIMVAYGISARISLGVLQEARRKGLKVGLFRPITLWPFPYKQLERLADQGKRFLSLELCMGQMVEDIKLAVNGKTPVDFYGRTGGMIPSEEEVLAYAEKLLGK
ncbi:MAG: 2-oxoglutarate ferredoxin oxidoreductase subunit alpha [Spirochaetes bacterium]|nr:MAG: 2-oxoglutarate ferredoxin oxidoreductase subunit alpha [Spirochaetota bacterium]